MVRKRGQIQFGETIAIVIILIILIVIGITFWSKIGQKNTVDLSKQFQELSVVELSKTVAELPELRCSQASVSQANCFDWYKVAGFYRTMNNSAQHDSMMKFYSNYFGRSRITITEVYPDERSIIIYNYNLSDTTTLQIKIPVIINDEVQNIKGIGYIVVEGFYR